MKVKKYHRELLITLGVILALSTSLILSNQIFFMLVKIDKESINTIAFIKYGFISYRAGLFDNWLFALFSPWFIATALLLVAKNSQKNIFGKAHWANMIEAKKAGLFAKEGIIVGKKWGQYLRIGGFEHVFVFAPSGSGKSTAIVIPNLMEWNGSCIVQDVKLTLFEITAKFRQKHGQKCFVWSPGAHDGRTHCYNPLDFISEDKALRIDDLQKIANIFIPDHPQKDPIWTAQPRMLFVALVLYLLDTEDRPKTIGEMVRVVKNNTNFSAWISKIIKAREDLDPLCYRNFNAYLQMEHRLQTNILQSFLSYFELFDNPMVDAATSKTDFDITKFRKNKMTVYVGVTANNLDRFSPLLTVFYQQTLDSLLKEMPDIKKEPHSMLFLLDEFSALRRMTVLQKGIGLLREYRVRVMPIIQDISQLNVTYGNEGAKSFINTKVRVAFAQNDLETSKLMSGWIGNKTTEQYTRNQNSIFASGGWFGSQSNSMTKTELIQPSEIMQLDKKKSIVFIEGNPPVLANKVFWYDDAQFKKRSIGKITLPKIKPIIIQFERKVEEGEAENSVKNNNTNGQNEYDEEKSLL